MRIVLLGAPGSGKGTQGELLRRKYAVPEISTGDMLRAAIAEGSPLGEAARAYVNVGVLVPDDVILDLMQDRLAQEDAAGGFILDGFPRSIPQAEGLEVLLDGQEVGLDRVVKIDVNKKVLLERMTSRRVCPGCGAVYNQMTRPPRVDGVCDGCGTHLVQREDDTEATVRKRLQVYETSTAPLIDWYDGRGKLAIVHGEGGVEAIFDRIVAALEKAAGAPGRGRPES